MRALVACLLVSAVVSSPALASVRSGGISATLSRKNLDGTYTLVVKNSTSAAGYVLSFTYTPVSGFEIAEAGTCTVTSNKITCGALFMPPGSSDAVALTAASGSPGSGSSAGTIVASLQHGGTTTTRVTNEGGSGVPTTTAKTPPGTSFRCSVYLAHGGGMVTFSTHLGHGVPAFDCAAEAKVLTAHNVGRNRVDHNRWTTQPQSASRTLVCLFHQAYFGSVLTISVRDTSATVISGDACTYLVVHAAR